MTRTGETLAWIFGIAAAVGAGIGLAYASEQKPAAPQQPGSFYLVKGHAYALTLTVPIAYAQQHPLPADAQAQMQAMLDSFITGAVVTSVSEPAPNVLLVHFNYTGSTTTVAVPTPDPPTTTISLQDLGPMPGSSTSFQYVYFLASDGEIAGIASVSTAIAWGDVQAAAAARNFTADNTLGAPEAGTVDTTVNSIADLRNYLATVRDPSTGA